MTSNDNNPASHWSLDKRVPLALVLTILFQTGVAIWWAAGQSYVTAEHARRLAVVEAQRAGERIAIVESRVDDLKVQLNRMEAKLDKLASRPAP